jgi:PPOX class probable F420-dependent enzyme
MALVPDDRVRQRFAGARVGHLATLTADGRPHIVPFCFVLVDDVVYTAVDAKPKSTLELKRLDNMRSNPAVSVLVDHYDDDWSQLWWVRLDGDARVLEVDDDTTADERARALHRLAEKYDQYRRQPPPGAVIAIDIHHWTWWP